MCVPFAHDLLTLPIPSMNLFQSAVLFPERTALLDEGVPFTYHQLWEKSELVAQTLLHGRSDLQEARIAFIMDPSFAYVAVQWGIWRAGGIAVPLCVKHPYPSIQYVLEDTAAEAIIFTSNYTDLISPAFQDFSIRPIQWESIIPESATPLPQIDESRRAMILYTSGTTGKPKGVVTTHQTIWAQVQSLVSAWEWTDTDHIANVLPLHHVHGIINALSCPLAVGATVEFMAKFKEKILFDRFLAGQINVFMAVPTIYFKLISAFKELDSTTQAQITSAMKTFRLMVSGSAALPISTLEQWKEISGHTLLERYGMTEIGMAISNPLHGERRPGHIGTPLPGVSVRLTDDHDQPMEVGPGEIQVQGNTVFSEYWNKPKATQESFTEGWFKTGDVAVFENGYYRILGRNSVDIIKTGGYKVSALEIEEVLRQRSDIQDCAVVGIPDDEWGEVIGAGLVSAQPDLDLDELTAWLKQRVPNYKVPRKYLVLTDLPRNVMGKVTKPDLLNLFL
jgi:malonyl-CoA/methylmalonyl-CoA synthetase